MNIFEAAISYLNQADDDVYVTEDFMGDGKKAFTINVNGVPKERATFKESAESRVEQIKEESENKGKWWWQ